MQKRWKLTLCALALLAGTNTALAADSPFTMDKMLADPDVMPALNGCVKAHPSGSKARSAKITMATPYV